MIALIHVLLIWLTLQTQAFQLKSEISVENPVKVDAETNNKFKTSINCNKTSIVVNFAFRQPFFGVIYANQIFSSYASECRSYGNGSEVVHFATTIKQCGVSPIESQPDYSEYQMVLYVQNDRNIQQASDEKVELRCAPQETLLTGVVKSRANNPIGHTSKFSAKSLYEGSVLQVHRMLSHNFSLGSISEAVECRMDVMKGRIPFLKPIDGFVDLGQDVTVMIKIRQIDGIDSMISRCYAHEGSHLVKQELTNNDGCSIDKNILPNFELMASPPSDYKVYYTTFPAFKFPDKTNLNIQCTVLICNTTCPQIQCDNTRPSSPALLRMKRHSDTRSANRAMISDPKLMAVMPTMPTMAVTDDHNNHSESLQSLGSKPLTATGGSNRFNGSKTRSGHTAANDEHQSIKAIGYIQDIRKLYISESDAQCLTSKIVLLFSLTLIVLLCSALTIACYCGHRLTRINPRLGDYRGLESHTSLSKGTNDKSGTDGNDATDRTDRDRSHL